MTLPKHRVSTHPGEVLREDVLKALQMSAAAFADWCGLPVRYVRELARERRPLTPEAAWAIGQAVGQGPQYWMGLQTDYDLTRARPRRRIPKLPR